MALACLKAAAVATATAAVAVGFAALTIHSIMNQLGVLPAKCLLYCIVLKM